MLTHSRLVSKRQQQVKKKKAKRRGSSTYILPYFVLVILLSLIPISRHLFILGAKWGYLKIQQIDIKGNYRITPEQIRLWTGIKEGLNILKFDLNCVTSIAEAQPWIKSLVIERKFPYTVSIQVEENSPAAIWEDGDDLFLMDEFGFLLENIRQKGDFPSLPVLACMKEMGSRVGQRCPFPYWSSGMSIVENIQETMPCLLKDVMKICIFSEDQAIIFLTKGRTLLVDISTSPFKFPLLKTLIEKMPEQWESMGYCDLRFEGKIIFG